MNLFFDAAGNPIVCGGETAVILAGIARGIMLHAPSPSPAGLGMCYSLFDRTRFIP
jgi:hypothetical protein